MLKSKSSIRTKVFAIIATVVLLATTFCTFTDKLPWTSGARKTEIAQTPTVKPTNDVVIEESISPLSPRILLVEPGEGQPVSLDESIELTFNQPMDADSVASAFTVVDTQGNEVEGKLVWLSSLLLSFTPTENLASGSSYTLTVSTKAKSEDGEPLAEDFTSEFTTVGDLMVSQVFPVGTSEDVPISSPITVIFNRPVVPLMITEDQDTLPNPLKITPEVPGTGYWLNTSVYVFEPEIGLEAGQDYRATVSADLTDTVGSKLVSDYSWNFSTEQGWIDSYYFSSGNYVSQDTYNNIPLTPKLTIIFGQPMDMASVEEAITVNKVGGSTLALDYEWKQDNLKLVISPKSSLDIETTYSLILDKTIARVKSGGSLQDDLHLSFTTFYYPRVSYTIPADDQKQTSFSSSSAIVFVSPMNIDSIAEHLEITPKPLGDKLDYYFSSWDYRFTFSGLQPATTYQVTLKPGAEDIQGNKITEEYSYTFTTENYTPQVSLNMPSYAPAVYRAGADLDLYFNYVNINSATFQVFQLSAAQFAESSWSDPVGLSDADLINEWTTPLHGKWNDYLLEKDILTKSNGQQLDPGFYLVKVNSPDIDPDFCYQCRRGLIIIEDTNLTIKTAAEEALVWATDIDTGKPLANVQIKLYDWDQNLVGSGTTDSDGLARITDLGESYLSYAVADDGQHFGYVGTSWGSGVYSYDFGINSAYNPGKQTTAYIYTDRPLYRPGQEVQFKGILRDSLDLDYSISDVSQVTVTIRDYNWTEIYKETLSVNQYGSFTGGFTLDEDAQLGSYEIQVALSPEEDATQIAWLSFNVADYQKPDYLLSIESDQTDVAAGEDFTFTVDAEYYAGGKVRNATVDWYLNVEQYFFQPEGEFSNYSFNDFNYYDMEDNDFFYSDQSRSDGEGVTDENGQFTITFPADLSAAKQSVVYNFQATVIDDTGGAVSGSQTVNAHLGKVYPGVRATQYVGKVGDQLSFDLVALDWEENIQPGQTLNVNIVQRIWNSVQVLNAEGVYKWETSVEEVPVYSTDIVMTAEGKGTVSFTPTEGGSYKAYVTAADGSGRKNVSSAFVWVAGEGFTSWQHEDNHKMEIVADLDSYEVGDTAEILIASPFEGERYALITVERGTIRSQEVVLLKDNNTIYKLPITADLSPNAFVSVLVMAGVDDTNPMPDYAIGMVQINVAREQREITLEVTPDKETAGPGDQVTYTITTKDFTGKPISAEVSLSLADLSVLNLVPANSQDIKDYFYGEQGLAVSTSVSTVYSIEPSNKTASEDYVVQEEAAASEMADGYSGGGGKGEDGYGVVDVRQDFRDTAYWTAQLTTDANGKATVTVTLPDNLTIWRMDARAVSKDTLVGSDAVDIRCTRPLLVRPQTPRFFVVDDQVILGASIQNNTENDINATVSLDITGVETSTPLTQQVSIPAGEVVLVTWPVVVQDVDYVDVTMSADGGGYHDAAKPYIREDQGVPVYRYEVPETVGTGGMLTEAGSITEAIVLPSAFESSQGTLTLKLEHSLAASILGGLDYLKHYEYECVEQTVSRFLPNVVTTQVLKAAGVSDPELEADLQEQVNTAIQRIYARQNVNGGWGWWSYDKTDPYLTAYVVYALIEAQNAGYHIDQDVLDKGVQFLNTYVRGEGTLRYTYEFNRKAFILYALSEAGSPMVSDTVELYTDRNEMDLYAKAYLAMALHNIDPGDSRVDDLISILSGAAITSANGSHWEETSLDWRNWNTNTRTTAVVLKALIQLDPENYHNAKAVSWLIRNRTNSYWESTYTTSWVLLSLTDWMDYSQEMQANYDYAVSVNGVRVGDGTTNRNNFMETQTLEFDIQELDQNDVNKVIFARDEGEGNLYYNAYLQAFLPVDQVEPLDNGFVISRSYYTLDDLRQPISSAASGDLFLARITIVVPNEVHNVIIEDPLPGGLVAEDQNLLTSSQVEIPTDYDGNISRRGWGWWYFDHVQMMDEKLIISADYLPAGTYVYTYLVRASVPGEYRTIPPTIQEFYFPEVYGRGAGMIFTVLPKE